LFKAIPLRPVNAKTVQELFKEFVCYCNMKAIVLKEFGGVENLIEADIPVPEISANEVLIKTSAIGINPVDIKTRKGKGLALVLKDFNPIILGWDISGTIVRTGEKAVLFREGDEVFGMVNFPGHGKAYAGYVSAPETHLSLKPSNITHGEAAAASLAALTAWQVLHYAGIKQGDRILIHSAAGGVGNYAVQISEFLGLYVAGTSSGKNRDFVLNLGASQHVDYEKERFEEVLHDFDFVLDTIGGEYIDRSLKVLKPGGTIICIPSGASDHLEEKAANAGMKGLRFLVKSNGADLKEVADLLEKGMIRSFVSKVFPFDEIRAAHLQIETGRTKGKIVVKTN
jgi:NADPH:quinone reductase-like Zn-dependent oxidoreductase